VALEENGATSSGTDPAAWQASRGLKQNATLHQSLLEVEVEVDAAVLRRVYKEGNQSVALVVVALALHQDGQPNTPRACS
jgi:hypothetical protein